MGGGNATQNEDIAKVEMTFSAEATELTKTSLSEDKVLWSEGDAISVFGGDYSNSEFKATSINGSSAEFSGLAVPTENYYAIYPYNASASYAEGVITTVLPANQAAVQGSFGNGVNLSAAKASAEGKFMFKNLCGLASLTVKSVPEGYTLTSITLQGRGGETLAGDVEVKVSDLTSTVSASGSTSITISADAITAGTYVFTVHPVELSEGLVITFKYGENGTSRVYLSSGVNFLAGVNNILPEVDAPAPENGTAESPYKISSLSELTGMSSILSALDYSTKPSVYFSLVADIDMKGVDWTPLYTPEGFPWGNYPVIHFNGNNHTISNLTVSGKRHASFFGVLIGECYNLNFANPVITADQNTPAGVVTSALSSYDRETKSVMTNVNVTGGTVTGINGYTMNNTWDSPAYGAGGLCGIVRNESKIYDSSFTGQVQGTVAGGIAGAAQAGGEITRCVFDGTVTAHGSQEVTAAYAGGIVGYMSGEGSAKRFWIKECYTKGSADASDSGYSAGGIAGFAASDTWVEKSYTEAAVNGRINAGGIVGSAWGTWGLTVQDCVAWCSSYHISPIVCDEQEGIGYITGGIKGGYNTLQNCLSNSSSVSLTWDIPNGEQNQTITSDASYQENYSTGEGESVQIRYDGKPANSLEEALASAGISAK